MAQHCKSLAEQFLSVVHPLHSHCTWKLVLLCDPRPIRLLAAASSAASGVKCCEGRNTCSCGGCSCGGGTHPCSCSTNTCYYWGCCDPNPSTCGTCSDSTLNGDEDGVDCGGSCSPCAGWSQTLGKKTLHSLLIVFCCT